MDLSPDKKLAAIAALEACPGWKDWLAPALRERMDAIKELLVAEQPEGETAQLRQEHGFLKAVLAKPEQTRAQLLARPAGPPVGNGAV